ncbi:auxin-responsive protein SAUR64-like [Chenopodium quinoa]|uniref:auxin-responsive protein SAUR64-like n=1 Tax=Chenopodium quinoa TaxID=63459 RepID=UPI000B76D835|nr:auxin-responsive protein SAUR64-like [Chenopodium quinoa]
MISTKKLIKMARKWQRLAAAGRRRIWSKAVEMGHFVVYTNDNKRFMIPLNYLKSEMFIELLKMAEEEFKVTSSGPITLPCNSNFMEYAISMIQKHVAEELEQALIMSLATCRYSSLSNDQHDQTNQLLYICSF